MHPLPPRKSNLKNYQIFILVFIALVITLLILGRLTNGLAYYHIPTGSNEPAIKPGDYIISTNLKHPKRFDFICYRMNDSPYRRQIWVHRLCGLPGDRIEIRNDTLFVNGENADDKLNLQKQFIVPAAFPDDIELDEQHMSPFENGDSLVATLQTVKHAALIKRGHPYIEKLDNAGDSYISKVYHHPWTVSNFGPYIVPIDKYFVMGDNRSFSMDSRYTGPLDMKAYFGTVIAHW